MRILHVVGRSHRRGAEIFAMELTAELELLGYENTVVAVGLADDGGREPELEPLVSRAHIGVRVLMRSARQLRKLLRHAPVDVVLAHGGWAVLATVLAIPRGGPIVVWQQILGLAASEWRLTRRWWWRLITRRVDAAVALNEDLAQEMRRLRFRGPVWVIPNARKIDRFAALDRDVESSWLRREIGVGPDVELVGFVGHLVAQKRPDRAIDVLGRLRNLGRDVHLVMAGGGLLAGEIEREVEARGLSDHVTMLGHRNDVERVFAGVDVVLLTSDDEGIPGVAIEAQMAGSPVVSFPLSGVGEVVEHDVTGIVLTERDTQVMAAQVGALLDDRPRLARMGERARALTPGFSVSNAAGRYAERIASLCTDLRP